MVKIRSKVSSTKKNIISTPVRKLQPRKSATDPPNATAKLKLFSSFSAFWPTEISLPTRSKKLNNTDRRILVFGKVKSTLIVESKEPWKYVCKNSQVRLDWSIGKIHKPVDFPPSSQSSYRTNSGSRNWLRRTIAGFHRDTACRWCCKRVAQGRHRRMACIDKASWLDWSDNSSCTDFSCKPTKHIFHNLVNENRSPTS